MTTAKQILATSALAAALTLPAYAYNDEITHPRLTIFATEKSVLYTDGSIMFNLGLSPANKQLFTYRSRVGSVSVGTATYPLSGFVAEGSFDEDLGDRALNHFFDPVRDRPLTIFFVPLGERSWRWVLEDAGPIAEQNRSLADARTLLTRGLTFNEGTPAAADEQRRIALATMFLTLGHAVHHIQDMAQPQHVRNDDHLDKYPMFGLNPFFSPSRYEKYTANREAALDPLAAAAAPVFPGSSDFKIARDFWFNSANTGIAQTVNREFVSHGTNFTIFFGQINTGTYALPQPGATTDFTVQELHAASGIPVSTEIQTLCGNPAIDCTMTMYATPVSTRASTLSIFDQDLRAKGVFVTYVEGDIAPTYQTQRLFALNNFNHDAAHQVLIGRAVSYSAGLINHFFRGKLEVTAPTNGPYAVVDHAQGVGFTKIKARVRNATPNEALPAGTIRAIAKFHRNGCYQADLSGEFQLSGGQLIPPCPNFRSAEAHLRMTAEQAASFGVGETKDMTFTFSEPIPLDATDLMLQVYYRGTVGTEPESHALGAADLSEPTFVAVMNATDVFELSGTAFHYYTDIIANITQPPYSIVDIDENEAYNVPPDVEVRGADINYEIFVNGEKVGDVPALPEGRFARIAALVGPDNFVLSLIARGAGFNNVNNYLFGSKTLQFDPESGFFIVSIVDQLRNHTLQFDSVTFFRFFPTTGTSLDDMPPSRAADATTPVAVQMTSQNLLEQEPSTSVRDDSPVPELSARTMTAASTPTEVRAGQPGTKAAGRTKAASVPVREKER